MKNTKLITIITTGLIISLISNSCSIKKETKADKELFTLTKAVKINAEKQNEIENEIKNLNASQIENKISINKLRKEIEHLKEENTKLKKIIEISNQENKKISQAIKLTIKSQENIINKIKKLEQEHNEKILISQGKIFAISITWLNIREKPSKNSKKLGILTPGTKKRVYDKKLDEKGNTWYKIDKGYISGKYSILIKDDI